MKAHLFGGEDCSGKSWVELRTTEFRDCSEEECCMKISCTGLGLNQLTGVKMLLKFESAGEVVEVIEYLQVLACKARK